jgi:hypothetical protein
MSKPGQMDILFFVTLACGMSKNKSADIPRIDVHMHVVINYTAIESYLEMRDVLLMVHSIHLAMWINLSDRG